jgi:hypothetical protein
MTKLFSKFGDSQVHFADNCIKINKRCKAERRCIVVTDANVYRHDPQNYKLKKERLSIGDIVQLSMSSSPDSFVVIHVKPPARDLVLDLGVSGEERTSECATVIYQRYQQLTGSLLRVVFTDKIVYNNARPKGKDQELVFRYFRFVARCAEFAGRIQASSAACSKRANGTSPTKSCGINKRLLEQAYACSFVCFYNPSIF